MFIESLSKSVTKMNPAVSLYTSLIVKPSNTKLIWLLLRRKTPAYRIEDTFLNVEFETVIVFNPETNDPEVDKIMKPLVIVALTLVTLILVIEPWTLSASTSTPPF